MPSSADCSSSMSALDRPLNWPGRFNVTVAIPSFFSTSSRASACVAAFDVMDPLSERNAVRDQAMLVRLAFEALPKIRMRNADEGLGAFGDRFPLEIDDAV